MSNAVISRQHDRRKLPDGWRWVRLGNFMPKSVSSLDPVMTPNEIYNLYSIPAFDRGAPEVVCGSMVGSTKQVVLSGDVLLSKIVPHIRRAWAVRDNTNKKMIASTEWIIFRTNDADSDYLKYVLTDNNFHREFMNTTSGVGGSLLRARPALVAQIEIPLPSLLEQRRIAAALREQMAAVDKARAAAQARLATIKDLPAAFLRQVFAPPGQSLPEGWRWVRLGDVASIIPGQHIMEADYNYNHIGVGYLTGPADFGESTALITKWTEKPKTFAVPGDILVTVKGAGVGKTNLAPTEKVAIGRQLMAVRATPDFFMGDFLYLFIMTQLAILSGRTLGATVPGLGRADLESLQLPLSPLLEQQRIVGILKEQMAAVKKIRAAAEVELEMVNTLPAALLRRAFAGEI